MKTILQVLFLVTIIFLFSKVAKAQSPWTKEKGEGYAQLSYTFLPAYKSVFDGNGDFYSTARKITDHTLQLYGEYGLLEGTTIVAILPLKILGANGTVDNFPFPTIAEGNRITPGDIQVGVRQKIYNKSVVIAGQLMFDLPTASYQNSTGLRSGYNEFAIKPMLSIGGGFNKGYIYGYSGVNIQTQNISHSVRSGVEGGYKVIKNLYLIGFLEMLNSFNNKSGSSTSFNNRYTGLYLNNQEYFSFGIKAFSTITENWGVTTSFAGAFSGQNVAGAPVVNLGVFYKWKKSEGTK